MNLNDEITTFIKSHGASLVGFADLKEIDTEARDNFPYGIIIAVALDPKVVSDIKIGPTAAYYAEYKKVNILLDELAQQMVLFFIKKGFKAKIRPATFEEDKAHLTAKLPHKTVATRAGLGWIGKSALLVTREYGPAVRLVSVLTDAPVTRANLSTNPCAPIAPIVLMPAPPMPSPEKIGRPACPGRLFIMPLPAGK